MSRCITVAPGSPLGEGDSWLPQEGRWPGHLVPADLSSAVFGASPAPHSGHFKTRG